MRRSLWLLATASLILGPALKAQDRPALPSLDYLQLEEPDPSSLAPEGARPPEPRLDVQVPMSEDSLSVTPPPPEVAPPLPPEPAAEVALPTGEPRSPRDIEIGTGGRLGVALVDAKGRLLLGFNREDRYALCSTFKAPLAAAVLAKVGPKGLGRKVKFSEGDIISHSPMLEKNRDAGRISVEQMLEGAVELSDNGAANLLLPIVGGPAGLTRFMRTQGDEVTRLDRTEPTLNENALGDPRDTTSPQAMATLMAKLLYANPDAWAAKTLAAWMAESPTGAKRIRGGLPEGWSGGSKTGTCNNAYNDVGFIRSPAGESFVLAVYLDRPAVPAPEAEAAIAEIARAVTVLLSRRVPPPQAAPVVVRPREAPAPLAPVPPTPALTGPSPPPPPKAPRSVLTSPDSR